ncbi:hypothetical protein ACVWYG_003318 [Pedobacter sp. UYEF25]
MMTQQEIFNKIGNILAELNQQYEYLARDSNELNDLEVELFLANADFLADHVKIIQKLHISNLKNEQKISEKSITEVMHIVPSALSPESDNGAETMALEEIVAAEQEEERVDIQSKIEREEEEQIHEKVAESKSDDFFKPDLDDRSFEFELEKVVAARGDVKEHEMAARENELPQLHDEVSEAMAIEEDEIGPEPFLIHGADEESVDVDMDSNNSFEQEEVEKEEVAPEPISSPQKAERSERNGIDLQGSLTGSSGASNVPSFSPEVVRTAPLANIFEKKEGTTLNDLLAKTNTKPSVSQKAPISDLKSAINLNEKMLFIKDLFGGYNMAYSEAIELVNKMTTFENAENFLRNNYSGKNNWAGKQGTVDQFYELLHRRFDN